MSVTVLKLFVLLAVFASVFLATQQLSAVTLTQRSTKREINKRLQLMRSGMDGTDILHLLRGPRRKVTPGTLFGPVVERFYRNAATANLSVSPEAIVYGAMLASMLLFILFLTLAGTTGWRLGLGTVLLTATAAAAIGMGLPIMYVNRRAQKRRKLMEEQFPVALDVFTRALRSGHPVSAAIELLTEEMPDPIGTEFGLVADEISYGSDLNAGLQNLADRWGLEDIRMFAVCVSVQAETGGNLAEILGNLGQVIRDRANLFLKVRALSSEGRMSAWMLSIMPVLTFVGLFLINPGFYLNVAQDPIFTTGFIALMVLYAIGVIWIRRMVDLKV